MNYDTINPQPRSFRRTPQKSPAASGSNVAGSVAGSPAAQDVETMRKKVQEFVAKSVLENRTPPKQSVDRPAVQFTAATLPKIPKKSAQLQQQAVQPSILISAARAQYPAALNAFIDRLFQNASSPKDQQGMSQHCRDTRMHTNKNKHKYTRVYEQTHAFICATMGVSTSGTNICSTIDCQSGEGWNTTFHRLGQCTYTNSGCFYKNTSVSRKCTTCSICNPGTGIT